MKTMTYTIKNNYNADFTTSAEFVRFTLTEQDVSEIKRHAKYLQDNNLHCVERFDDRCVFLDEGDDETNEAGSYVECDFRADCTRLAIFPDYIVFTGYEKHGGDPTEWSTSRLTIDEILEAFGDRRSTPVEDVLRQRQAEARSA